MPDANQMYAHELNGVKGFLPANSFVVDKTAPLDADETAANALAGRVVHLVGNGAAARTFVLGSAALTATNAPMPFFLFQNADDYDVIGPGFNFTGAGVGGHAPVLMGLAANFGAEIESTEYVTGGSPSYNSGDLLFGAATTGLLTKLDDEAVVCCGVVSDGLSISELGDRGGPGVVRLLRFHTCYLPRFDNIT